MDLLNKYDSDNNNELDDEEMEALLKVGFFLDRVRQCARVCVWCVYVCVCFCFLSGGCLGKAMESHESRYGRDALHHAHRRIVAISSSVD